MSEYIEFQIHIEPKIINSKTLQARPCFESPDIYRGTVAIATDKILKLKTMAEIFESVLAEIPLKYIEKLAQGEKE